MYRYILLLGFWISTIFNIQAQTSFEAIVNQGIELHDKGDYEGAIRLYKQGLNSYPESMLLYYEIALSYLAMENYQETINWSEKALKATDELQNVSIVYALLGSAYDNQERPEEALEIFNEAIAKSGDDYILYFNKGVTLQKLNDIKGAADAYLMALLLK
ncbi:MAG: tetratricopeptide repeat protein [Tannerellaceae bacterium]|nr:tetratricopeptide repeat protein [Tannerellaceae bacterium]